MSKTDKIKELLTKFNYVSQDELLNTDRIKDIISKTGLEAEDILHAYDPKIEKQFNKACSDLAKIVKEMRKDFPHANIYVQEDQVLLLLGLSHDSAYSKGNQEVTAITNHDLLGKIDGGGW